MNTEAKLVEYWEQGIKGFIMIDGAGIPIVEVYNDISSPMVRAVTNTGDVLIVKWEDILSNREYIATQQSVLETVERELEMSRELLVSTRATIESYPRDSATHKEGRIVMSELRGEIRAYTHVRRLLNK